MDAYILDMRTLTRENATSLKVISGSFNRKCNEQSSGEITVAANCFKDILVPWRNGVEIVFCNQTVFMGWITRVQYDSKVVRILFDDLTGILAKRVPNKTYSGDIIDVAKRLVTDELPEISFDFVTDPNGYDVEIGYQDYIHVLNAFNSLEDYGLNWSSIGTTMFFFLNGQRDSTLFFTDDNFNAALPAEINGYDEINRVIVKGANHIGIAETGDSPVLEKYLSLRDLKTQEQVDRYAQSQLNVSPYRMNVETTVKLKNLNCNRGGFDVNTLIPGQYAYISSTLCPNLSNNYRLCDVQVDIVLDSIALGFK